MRITFALYMLSAVVVVALLHQITVDLVPVVVAPVVLGAMVWFLPAVPLAAIVTLLIVAELYSVLLPGAMMAILFVPAFVRTFAHTEATFSLKFLGVLFGTVLGQLVLFWVSSGFFPAALNIPWRAASVTLFSTTIVSFLLVVIWTEFLTDRL